MKKNYADMDPLEEIRAIREEISKEFATMRSYGEFLRKNYPTAPSAASPPARKPRTKAKTPSRRRKALAET